MSSEQIKKIKLTENIIEKENLNIEQKDLEMELNLSHDHKFKSEYKITPKMNDHIYKLDPMIIIGIGLLIALLFYLGYKYSNQFNETIELNE